MGDGELRGEEGVIIVNSSMWVSSGKDSVFPRKAVGRQEHHELCCVWWFW